MKRYIAFTFICLMAIAPLAAQYIDEISEFTQQGVGFDMSNARSSAAFLDWSKVQMNHSVSMSEQIGDVPQNINPIAPAFSLSGGTCA